jgi:hypothetical protein
MATLAGQIGLSRLYHCQDFNLRISDDHVGCLTDILQNHRTWCSNPATFNDPWDCKPSVLGKDPKTRVRHQPKHRRTAQQQPPFAGCREHDLSGRKASIADHPSGYSISDNEYIHAEMTKDR